MKTKSSKLRKLEKGRYSILTKDMDSCFLCKYQLVDIHEIYGGSNRKKSMEHGFCVPLCRYHHEMVTNKPLQNLVLKQMCQKEFEKNHTREEFMIIIGRNYL